MMLNKLIESIKEILVYFSVIMSRGLKKKLIAVLISMFIVSTLELLGLSAIYPFIQMLTVFDIERDKWYVSLILRIFPDFSTTYIFLTIGIFVIVIYVLKNVLSILCSYIQNKYAGRFQREVSTKMLSCFLEKPYSFFIQNNSAILIRGINVDTVGAYNALLALIQGISEILTVLMLGFFLAITDFKLTVCAIVLAVICLCFILAIFKQKVKKSGRIYRESSARMTQSCYQAISGIKEIITLDKRDFFIDEYNIYAREYEKAQINYKTINAYPDRLLEAIGISFLVIYLCLDLTFGSDASQTIPVIGTFAVAMFKILPSFGKITSRMNDVLYAYPSVVSCYNNIRSANNDQIKSKCIYKKGHKNNTALFRNRIKIEDLSFGYDNADTTLFNHVNLSIERGNSIAFVGESGAGKTTIADLIMGLLTPTSGRILCDEYDIHEIPEQWSKIIGYVPQMVFLTDDTIKANVAFGINSDEIDDEKVIEALKQAEIYDYIKTLPDKLDTIVGERGIKFSGGQRQRLAIARALYNDPDILVLDEATSALDSDTESAVMHAIERLHGEKTLIIIAHRIATIRKCNKIYEVGNANIVERKKSDYFNNNEE